MTFNFIKICPADLELICVDRRMSTISFKRVHFVQIVQTTLWYIIKHLCVLFSKEAINPVLLQQLFDCPHMKNKKFPGPESFLQSDKTKTWLQRVRYSSE